MADLLRQNGVDRGQFNCSNGWCIRFCRRWGITAQCRTNGKATTVLERLPQIRSFHQWLIYGLQRSSPQRCPKYGRFPPHRMFHMDQVPLAFVTVSSKTLNAKGRRCVLAVPSGADMKRYCTLQVTICAQPDQQLMPLEIIFRGKDRSNFTLVISLCLLRCLPRC